MCDFNPKNDSRKIDPCMEVIIDWLRNKHIPVSCCCGHGKYPMTIVVKEGVEIYGKRRIIFREIFSGIILRIKDDPLDDDPVKFYKKDGNGIYYIPEVMKEVKP